MSINTFVEEIQTFSDSKRKTANLYNIQKCNPIILQNFVIYPPECVSFLPLDKNGCKEMEIKSGISYLDPIKIKSHENLFKFNELKNNYINFINYQKIFRIPSKNDNYTRPNFLESTTSNSKELGPISRNPNSDRHLFIKKHNENLYNEVFQKFPLISAAFKQKDYVVNNNICQSPKALFKINNISKPREPSLIKTPKTKKRRFSNQIKTQKCEINEKQKKNKKQEIFIIPNEFLIDFNIKEININNLEKTQSKYVTNLIDLKEAGRFINNLCQTNKNNKENVNNINFINQEYIESKNTFLLQKKRKASSDFNELKNNNNINSEVKRRRGRAKNKNKNKNKKKMTEKLKKQYRKNNRKDGKKISLYLNQIQINSNSLDIFPFCPMDIENIKIEFLQGLIEEKHIKVNSKNELINDHRNLKYIKNKSFEIIYQHKEEEKSQYILHINNDHIFYLFFYYYYQIQKKILRLNQHFYSHRSKAELEEVKGGLQNLMEKSNKLAQEIIKYIE